MKTLTGSTYLHFARRLALAYAVCWSTCTSFAQTFPAQALGSAPRMLTIEILEGEGELNDVRARTAREPIVQVNDENHKPVAGALVLFSIQSGGGQPNATFARLAGYTTRTDAQGRAVAHGFTPTKHTGSYQIHVEAQFSGVTATADIHETNIAKGSRLSRFSSNHTALVSVVDAAVGAAAISSILVTSRDPSATTVTAGTGTVTAP